MKSRFSERKRLKLSYQCFKMSDFYNYFIKKKVKAYICDLCMCVCVYGGVSDFDYYGYLHNQEIIQTNLNLPKCSDFLAIRITR